MADVLEKLNEEDRADLLARLGHFGLDATAIATPDLVTSPQAITTLHVSPDTVSPVTPVLLRTSSFDQVAQWIGVPDETFDKTPQNVELPPALKLDGGHTIRPALKATRSKGAQPVRLESLKREDLSSQQLSAVRKAARAYLHGDSRVVKDYKSVIEAVFPSIQISLWPFLDVVVRSGSVLLFGPGPHVLLASSVIIEDGGRIRSYGTLTVNATRLNKTSPHMHVEIDASLLAGRVFKKALFE